MKKHKSLFIGGTLAAALILGACSTDGSASADDMEWETEERSGTVTVQEDEKANAETSAQDAVDKALKEFDGTVTEVEYDEDDGVYYYEIEIENGDEDFNVKLNAEDLSVIEQDMDRDDDRDDRDDDGEDDRDDQGEDDRDDDESAQNSTDKQAENKKGSTDLADAFKDDGAEEAITTAKENFDGILESITYEEDDGRYYYEVQLENKNEEYEVKLDSEDFSVLEEERDDDNNDRGFKKLEAAHEEQIISFEEAVKLAKENVNGEVRDWQYDVDDFEFEFEINDTEVKIDAKSGQVTELDD